jgi:hypothetical protein
MSVRQAAAVVGVHLYGALLQQLASDFSTSLQTAGGGAAGERLCGIVLEHLVPDSLTSLQQAAAAAGGSAADERVCMLLCCSSWHLTSLTIVKQAAAAAGACAAVERICLFVDIALQQLAADWK